MKPTRKPLPPLEDWQAGTLRLTAFFKGKPQTSPTDWWREAVGGQPETVIQQPQVQGESIIGSYGTHKDSKLVLSTNPIRVDWTLGVQGEASLISSFAGLTLGSLQDSLEPFSKLANRWFSSQRVLSINRLAFGAIALMPTSGPTETYDLLSEYLPFKIEFGNSSDFLYQINRHTRSSVIPELTINRLMKWNSIAYQQFSGPLNNPLQLQPLSGLYACQLELDINTAPAPDVLPHDVFRSLFQELVELGLEIAEKGDNI